MQRSQPCDSIRCVTKAQEHKEPASRDVQKRIVEAAITCIERDGLNGVTIRSIAGVAGVNSAAISYYFRSKDALMAEALAVTLENAFGDWEALLKERTGDLRSRIRSILIEVIEGSLKFPGIVKAHLYDTFANGASRTPFLRRFARFLASVSREMAVLFPDRSVREVGSEVVQMVSAVLLPGVLPQLFRNAVGVDLSRSEGRAAYIDSLIEHFFPIPAAFH